MRSFLASVFAFAPAIASAMAQTPAQNQVQIDSDRWVNGESFPADFLHSTLTNINQALANFAGLAFTAAGNGATASASDAMRWGYLPNLVTDYGADPTGAADSTPAVGKAHAACVQFYVPPGTYSIHDETWDASCATFSAVGIPGLSVFKRNSASGSNFFTILSANVSIDGVVFDSNKANVSANQWGVLLNAGGQNVFVRRSVFKNNSGSLGSCFALLSTGPGAGGSFTWEDSEVTGCTSQAAWFGSVSNGTIKSPNVHDNGGTGLFVGAYLTPSESNYATNIRIVDPNIARNVTGILVGGVSPPYTWGTPTATSVTVVGGILTDNTGYELALQGDDVSVIGTTINAASATPLGGIDCNSRRVQIESVHVSLPNGSTWGIDCGGSLDPHIVGNEITMSSGNLLNLGGTQNGQVIANKIYASNGALAVTILATEADGNGSVFTTVTSGLQLKQNQIHLDGAATNGVDIFDNAGGYNSSIATVIAGNDFFGTNGALASNAIHYYAGPLALGVKGNTWNGAGYTFIDPNGNGDVVAPDVIDEVIGLSATGNVRTIVIEPYDRSCLGSNSYDVHLGKWLATYKDPILDARKHNLIEHFEIPEEGFILLPNKLYLGVTMEYTETHAHVPFLEGKSSVGRLGIDIHATAGKGDVGFCNNWTLEISVSSPVRIYAGMPIGQLIYFLVQGDIINPYNKKASAKYNHRDVKPMESMMWKNKF